MIKNSMKKIVVCIIIALMVTLAVSKTFASEDLLNALLQPNGNNTQIDGNEAVEIENGKVPENIEKTNNVPNNNENKNTQNNTPTETPNLGVGDYSTYIFIGIFAVSAIYAYKKVRDYNG